MNAKVNASSPAFPSGLLTDLQTYQGERRRAPWGEIMEILNSHGVKYRIHYIGEAAYRGAISEDDVVWFTSVNRHQTRLEFTVLDEPNMLDSQYGISVTAVEVVDASVFEN